MIVSFDLENILYLKLDYQCNDENKSMKLALKNKLEKSFIAVSENSNACDIQIPQKVYVQFISDNGIYKTETVLQSIEKDEEYTYYTLANPTSLDYFQNREYYRIKAEYDCIYTIDTNDGAVSYNAVTYDISPGGISIIMDENVTSIDDTSIVVFLPMKDIKSHLRFIRSEVYDGRFKLSFEYTDLKQTDLEIISDLCLKSQLKQE